MNVRRHLVFLLLVALAATTNAATFDVFGPRDYQRVASQPERVVETFAARNTAVAYTLRLANGGANASFAPVTSAIVTLNGVEIFGPKDFTAKTPAIVDKSVTLRASNELVVELRGNPGAGITLRISGDDSDNPSITASVSPQPNAAGWVRSVPVTVTFTCNDGTSAIASCTEPFVLEGDGANITVSGKAVDAVGNTAETTVTLNVDATPPVLAVAPLASSTSAGSVTVAGTALDTGGLDRIIINGSSVTHFGGDFATSVALQEGANTITVEAVDRAGNQVSRTFSIESFSIPAVAIASPADLAVLNASSATVTGTVSAPNTSVLVNGVAASVAGTSFTATNVPLAQGRTVITATATTAGGHSGTTSINVYRDAIPPRVTLRYPTDNLVLYQPTVDVTGMVDDIVVGTINAGQATITVNGIAAEVANRAFVARDVPLVPGPNALRVVATDQGGNSATTTTLVSYDASAKRKIVEVAGQGQTAAIGATLSQPLVVRLLEPNGAPAAGQSVTFEVIENDGTLAGPDGPRAAVTPVTDAAGEASARWTLGNRAGAGNNRVQARASGFSGVVIFDAVARTGTPSLIVIDSGNAQFGALDAPLARPLVVAVVDAGSNRLANVPVTFTVREGGGSFDGQQSTTINTDSDGRAWARPTLGATTYNTFVATTSGVTTEAFFYATGKDAGAAEATSVSGVVLDNTDAPIAGVTVRVDGTTLVTETNEQGQFTIAGAPVGYVKLLIDGSTARRPGTWPTLEFAMYTIPGADNTLEMPIYLLPLDVRRGLFVDEVTGGTLTIPELPGFSLTVKPGSATFPGGGRTGTVSVTMVHADKMPMPPGFGQQPRFIVTIQPPGVHFDPPAAITFPNVDGLAPMSITELYSFDHDLGQFVAIGTGSVSADGTVIRSDPGVGIIKGGWHCGGNPAPAGTAANCPKCKKCENNTCVPDPSKNYSKCSPDHRICINGKCVCPVPTGLTRTFGAAVGGRLEFRYSFGSSTGEIVDLGDCEVGEIVTYSGNGVPLPGNIFATLPPFPYWEFRNPTVRATLAVSGEISDSHSEIPGAYIHGPRAVITASQRYFYRCPCANGGNPVTFGGPYTITRRIYDDAAGNWYLMTAKDGVIMVTSF